MDREQLKREKELMEDLAEKLEVEEFKSKGLNLEKESLKVTLNKPKIKHQKFA